MPKPTIDERQVFLNVPYDDRFQSLYLAYIVGLVSLGLKPAAALQAADGATRLDRIDELIRTSRHSIHDLSRVELSYTAPATPRFNMPFELGMAVCWARQNTGRHTYILFESKSRRAPKSLSDLAGADFNIHDGTPEGVMRELCNAFVRQNARPKVPDMMNTYKAVVRRVPAMLRESGSKSLFTARSFEDLTGFAAILLQHSS